MFYILISFAMALGWSVMMPGSSEPAAAVSAVCSTLWSIAAIYFMCSKERKECPTCTSRRTSK